MLVLTASAAFPDVMMPIDAVVDASWYAFDDYVPLAVVVEGA